MDKYQVLLDYFGYTEFRQGQSEVIDSVLAHKDVLAVMPTGAGKSICFQIPALMFDGVTVVVSPLISLMKDQVNALVQNGVSAAYINSSLTDNQIKTALLHAAEGKYKIIYVAPERLMTNSFLELAKKINIPLLCVDEAHCVSQWGQDFRPSYLYIKQYIDSLPVRPVVMALTATATQRVRDDIVSLIGLNSPAVTVLSFDRKNLYFEVVKPKSKPAALRKYLNTFSGRSGIIYCSSRKITDSLYLSLLNEGYSVTKYHAGLDSKERKINQELFINDDKEIIIATNAFGMGIDKSNVSFVIHYNMPGDIESYYQEAGRAGRDGNRADCILLFGKQDILTQRFFIENPEENDELTLAQRRELYNLRVSKLNSMIGYCETKTCLRAYILTYFGEVSHEKCQNCSSCLGVSNATDITVEAKKILSCVIRAKQKEPSSVIIDILRGESTNYICKNGYDTLSTFGIMSSSSDAYIQKLINYLASQNYIYIPYKQIKVNDKGWTFLRGNNKIYWTADEEKKERRSKRKEYDDDKVDLVLMERLRVLRKTIANIRSVPAFVVFSDATLKQMAIYMPTNLDDFSQIPGVGKTKLKQYGTMFIKEICAYKQEKENN